MATGSDIPLRSSGLSRSANLMGVCMKAARNRRRPSSRSSIAAEAKRGRSDDTSLDLPSVVDVSFSRRRMQCASFQQDRRCLARAFVAGALARALRSTALSSVDDRTGSSLLVMPPLAGVVFFDTSFFGVASLVGEGESSNPMSEGYEYSLMLPQLVRCGYGDWIWCQHLHALVILS
jgi:hypothetical protein